MFARFLSESPLLASDGLPLTWFIVIGGVVAVPLLVLMPDYSYRYGLQWLVLFACGGCSAWSLLSRFTS